MHTDNPECRWSNFFINWLRTVSDATIVPIYRTEGGTLPTHATMFLTETFHNDPLTRRDIVIFDYSMNEALVYINFPHKLYEQEVNVCVDMHRY
jgi:hypothetical protein